MTVPRRVEVPRLAGEPLDIRRVRVLVDVSTATSPVFLSADKPVSVYSGAVKFLEPVELKKTPVSLTRRGSIVLGEKDMKEPVLILLPQKGESLAVGEERYGGYLVLLKRADAVNVINWVDMEQYIGGVVTCEMPHYFNRSAFEAQAVAARTYVFAQMRRRRLEPYDVFDDQRSQVYRGLTGTRESGRDAAQATRGVVLLYDWKFLEAFYFSTCGGHTADAAQMANAPRIKPFTGVECDYCRDSKRYKWVKTIPVADVEEALARRGYVSGRLEDVVVTSTGQGGWVDVVEVISKGSRARIAGSVFRQALGTGVLYSAKLEIRRSGEEFVIQGRGFGHGVGMCQWGAYGLGRRGKNYAEILQYYYPGAELVKTY
ncbi:MAG: SpoIID/LytB domain-containing protein [Planctomycetota bacterium]